MSFANTLRFIWSDYRRMSALTGIALSPLGLVFIAISPSIVALTLYRLSHWLYGHELRSLSWLLWVFSSYVTGVDITPSTKIGRSCYIGHAVGTILCGKVGDNVSFFAGVVMGGGRGHGDVGGGDGLPVIGNNVFVGARALVVGHVLVGDNAIIGAAALVLHDVPAGMVVYGAPARVIKPVGESLDFNAIAAAHSAGDL